MIRNLYEKDNRQLVVKSMTFVMAALTALQVSFINGSIAFWGFVCIVAIYNLYLMIIDVKGYFKKYKYELLFFIICTLASSLQWQYHNIYSFVYIITTANLVFSLVVNENEDKIEEEFQIIGWMVILFTFIVGVFSLGQSIFSNPTDFLELAKGGRYTGVYNNPNQLAYWCIASMVFSYKMKKHRILFLNLGLQFFLLLISGCRSAYLGLIVIVIFNAYIKTNNKKLILFAGLGTIFLIVAYTLFRYQWVHQYLAHFDEGVFNILSGNRYYLWKEVFSIFLKNPIIGVGVHNLRNAAENILGPSSIIVTGNWEDPHNILLSLLGYTGIAGLTVFVIMIKGYIQKAFNFKHYFEISVVLGCLVIGLFDIGVLFDDRIISVVFWFFVGMCIVKGGNKDE